MQMAYPSQLVVGCCGGNVGFLQNADVGTSVFQAALRDLLKHWLWCSWCMTQIHTTCWGGHLLCQTGIGLERLFFLSLASAQLILFIFCCLLIQYSVTDVAFVIPFLNGIAANSAINHFGGSLQASKCDFLINPCNSIPQENAGKV